MLYMSRISPPSPPARDIENLCENGAALVKASRLAVKKSLEAIERAEALVEHAEPARDAPDAQRGEGET
jgi:hypothetical protein